MEPEDDIKKLFNELVNIDSKYLDLLSHIHPTMRFETLSSFQLNQIKQALKEKDFEKVYRLL